MSVYLDRYNQALNEQKWLQDTADFNQALKFVVDLVKTRMVDVL